MQTVTELHSFRKAAIKCGMSEEDIEDLVDFLSQNAGDEIVGTGGCRKVRFSIRGNAKGKSGGVRTITLFSGVGMPVFLITVFAKSQKISLSASERNNLKGLSDKIVSEYERRVSQLSAGDRA